MTDHHDVIIIGSGAGGGTMFQALGATGKRVLLLERGDFLTREKQNWSPVAVWGEHRYRNAGPYLDRDGQPLAPKQHFYVGGNTKVYGAVLFRMRERDFGVIEHHGGTSPEWPLTYDDFELPNRSTCACRRSCPRRHPDAIAASKPLASTPPSAHSVRQGVNCCKQRREGQSHWEG